MSLTECTASCAAIDRITAEKSVQHAIRLSRDSLLKGKAKTARLSKLPEESILFLDMLGKR
jgi:hypothetical protein